MILIFFQFSFFLAGIISLLLGLFVYLKNKQDVISKTFFGCSFCSAVWSLGFYALIISNTYEVAYFWRMFMDIGAIILPAFWMHFLYSVLGIAKIKKTEILVYYFIGIFIIILNIADFFSPGIFVTDLTSKDIFNYYPVAGFGYYLFLLFYLIIIPKTFYNLFKYYSRSLGLESKKIKYLILASIFGFLGGGTAFFLTFNIPIAPYGIMLFAFYPVIIVYSITSVGLFNIKILTAEIAVASLWILILVRIFITENTTEQIISSGLLVSTILVGVLLIRSVKKEVKQKEEIEKLAKKLEKTNNKLRELDKLKTEFLSLATHQIRSPLTSMRGYISMIFEGDYGDVNENLKEPLRVVEKSSEGLVKVVNDFLDVSRIEQGRMKYNLEIYDFHQIVKNIIEEYRPAIEEKGLKIEFEAKEDDYSVKVDENKMEQVIGNLIDNAIKYTIEGEIKVRLFKNDSKTLQLEVSDSGVGIPSEEIKKLFTKFQRAKGAEKTNVTGTGLGIYLAKRITEDHGGTIKVSSEGEGKGSVFTVTLPVV